MQEKENIPEKGAALQKDMETYATIPYIPGGIDDIMTDLGMETGGFIGKCVRAVKFCIGSTYIRKPIKTSWKLDLKSMKIP